MNLLNQSSKGHQGLPPSYSVTLLSVPSDSLLHTFTYLTLTSVLNLLTTCRTLSSHRSLKQTWDIILAQSPSTLSTPSSDHLRTRANELYGSQYLAFCLARRYGGILGLWRYKGSSLDKGVGVRVGVVRGGYVHVEWAEEGTGEEGTGEERKGGGCGKIVIEGWMTKPVRMDGFQEDCSEGLQRRIAANNGSEGLQRMMAAKDYSEQNVKSGESSQNNSNPPTYPLCDPLRSSSLRSSPAPRFARRRMLTRGISTARGLRDARVSGGRGSSSMR